VKASTRISESLPALRWGLLAALAAAALWLALLKLPGRAAWINGGVLFSEYICLSGCLLVAAGAWVRGSLRGLGWPVLLLFPLVAALFVRGAEVSSDALVNFGAIPYFSAGTLLWAALGARETGPPAPKAPGPWLWALGLLLLGAGLGTALVLLRRWVPTRLQWSVDLTSVGMLLPVRMGNWMNDISGGPFAQWDWLGVVALWTGLLAALVALRGRIKEAWMPPALFVVALLGKLAMAGLSTQGMGIVPMKIESLNNNYFTYAGTIRNPLSFLNGFNAVQGTAGPHIDVHPPAAVLLYWLLRTLLFSQPTLVALAIMALSAAAVWPFYRLGRGLGGPDLGLAAAALFLTSPLSLILGNAGIDSVVLSLVALSAWCLWEAVRAGSWKWAAASGAALGLAILNSFGAISTLVFLGSWGLLLLWRQERGWDDFLKANLALWGVFAVTALLLVGSLSLGGFDYLKSMASSKAVHMAMNQYRSYSLWSWGNVLLYAAYAGMGLVTLWVLRVGGSLFNADTSDPFTLAGAATVMVLVLSAYGRAEVQREYLFGAVFMLPAAAAALPRGRGGRLQWQALAVALGLNVLSAVLLQICVLDYW
jgi:hypothetical protein